MCGIVAYSGFRESVPIILSGLERLSYRGYDSSGLATVKDDKIVLRREHGKLENLTQSLADDPILGCTGIGHTRWATHGRPSIKNAHPHCHGKIALVHNGIIENYLPLREALEARGRVFYSETDTEVMAHLLSDAYEETGDLKLAMRRAVSQVTGAYALAAIAADSPDKIVVARLHSPLLVALGEGENFAASDISAVLEHTRRFIFLEDGDFAELSPETVVIFDSEGRIQERPIKMIEWDITTAEKRGYPHFMLKEIYEQPEKIADTLRGRITCNGDGVSCVKLDPEVEAMGLESAKRIQIVACGTSYYAGLLAKYVIEKFARIPVDVEVASEYRYRDPILGPDDVFIAISQSGETADTYACLKLARLRGAKILSICNVMDATIPRASDATFYTRADAEIGVCSTKAFTTQVATLLLLAIYLGQKRDTLAKDDAQRQIKALKSAPEEMAKILDNASHVRETAKVLLRSNSFLFLGRNIHYPIALEGALKLKELTYIHAEAYPAGEMKHGPIALIDEKLPVIAIAPQSEHYEKTLSNLQEVKARGGRIIAILTEGDQRLADISEHSFAIPPCDLIVQPFYCVAYLQLLAYHIADLLGNDVDQPRNLAKSVTVE